MKFCWCSIYVLIVFNNYYYINSLYCIFVYIVYVGGYKGLGLGFLVEIFCGILSGFVYGLNIRRWKNTIIVVNLVCINLLFVDVCGGLVFLLICEFFYICSLRSKNRIRRFMIDLKNFIVIYLLFVEIIIESYFN